MHGRTYPAACALALVLLAAAYANHFHGAFHLDDFHTIVNNLFIRDLANIPRFFVDPRTFSALPANQSYRPLVTATLALDYRIGGGLRPEVLHATNFGLLVLQCAAMLVLFRRLLDVARPHPWNRWVALFATAWYGVHTANAETVNYLIARSDILSTFATSVAVLMFTSRGVARTWQLYLIPAAAAVFAKEQGAMAAPLLFLYTGLFERQLSLRAMLRPRELRAVLRETWPAFVICGAIVVAGMLLSTTFAPGGSRWPYLFTQPFVLLRYAWMLLMPVGLSADTDWQPVASAGDPRVWIGLLFMAAALWAAWSASRTRVARPVSFGILWFFVALAPTSSVVPLAEVTNDHRMFFPFVGATLAVAWAGALLLMRREERSRNPGLLRQVVAGAAVALLLAHAYGTRQRNAVWATEESLWLDVTRKSPRNGRGLMTYGVIQMGKGNLAAADEYFNRALQFTPEYAYLHVNLGVLKGAQGNREVAEAHFREAQRLDPGNPISYQYYARWLHSAGRTGEAIPMARRAVELSPGDAAAKRILDEMIAPATPEGWLSLSLAEYQAGRYQECIDASLQALKLRPDYAEAYNNICAAENSRGRFAEAAAACERALAIKPDYPLAKNNLAVATARLKK
jgi:tetratricopeptide (TPR) repeat protein